VLYCWRRSQVKGGKCMVLRPKSGPCIPLAHTSGFGRFSVRFKVLVKESSFIENLIRRDPCMGKLAIVD
jgi:hypothetical protein